jgi:glucose/arabinose dehydrogenase
MTRRAVLLLVLALPLAAWAFVVNRRFIAEAGGGPRVPSAPAKVFELALVVDDLAEPVHLTAPPGDAARLFICEKGGRIRIVRGGRTLEAPFLDIASRVSRGSEQGLLSLAFHPRYAENGRFFIYFTDRKGDVNVVERRVSQGNPDRADPDFERQILQVEHRRFPNHDGGLCIFGPDGMLYMGLGDGGGAGDPFGNGQNKGALLAKILRVDVDARGDAPYAIPPTNPFAKEPGARPEVWVWGMRNPWRFAFDRETGDLYIADVGQDKWEEVDVQPAGSKGGENYGWNRMEGLHEFSKRAGGAGPGLVPPVLEYGHDAGCSITGGLVYRGAAIPAIRGRYFFADYCSGMIRSFRWNRETKMVEDYVDWTEWVNPKKDSRWTSFGEDAKGEMYLLCQDGPVYRFDPVAEAR